MRNADAWGKTPCSFMQSTSTEVTEWVALANASFFGQLSLALPATALSSMWYRTCNGSRLRVLIEPIAGVLRHPYTCNDIGKYLLRKDWLVIDWEAHRLGARKFLFDVGASTWTAGSGGASQQWFWDVYVRRGVRFGGRTWLLVWERATNRPRPRLVPLPLIDWPRCFLL